MFRNIEEFFKTYPKAAIAFSGGVDSSFLFYAALQAGARIKAYYIKTPFQPEFELEDAKRIAELIGGEMEILTFNHLTDPDIFSNTKNRCYFCKKKIFTAVLEAAKRDEYEWILDGTNADDDENDRPGMAALSEMGVRSPLRECGYTKERIRKESKAAGLFTWNKPSYACLATRIQTGEEITEEKLIKTEKAESFLHDCGFRDCRVRLSHGTAKIQVREDQMEDVFRNRKRILTELKQYYDAVVLDLNPR